jgi:hypothetical protein
MSHTVERRRATRASGSCAPAPWRVRLRAGGEAVVVNVSSLGILLEGETRLLPGHRCTLRWMGPGHHTGIAGRILRAEVTHVDPDRGVKYRSAVEFDEPHEHVWASGTRGGK